MKNAILMMGMASAVGLIGLFHANTTVSADAYPTTSIIDQIEHPNKGNALNNNGARNWEMSGNQYMIQATTNGEIPYQITSKDPYYQKIWTDAANAWNKLGVIKLVPVTTNAQITLGGDEHTNKQNEWYGTTGTEVLNDDNNPNIGYMRQSSAKLSGDLSKKANNYQLNLTVAEHEIGHTLGFEHDDTHQHGKYHVMHDGISRPFVKNIQPLGKYEKQTLLKYYTPGQTRGPQDGFLY